MNVRKLLAATVMIAPVLAVGDAAAPEWVEQARQKSAQLGSSLVAELREAMATQGPVGGVEICNTRAPEIAHQVSGNRFEVSRTALRVRNPANAPDDWEKMVLRRFEQSMERGVNPAGLEVWDVKVDGNGRIGRYMKAIPTGQQCIVCHGDTIAPPLKETIQRLYPEDQATGFEQGDLRGAFSVKVNL